MATEESFAELAALIAASPRVKFGSGVPPQIIDDAERQLGMRFPPSYRWWLSQYGAGYIGGHELQGLCPEPFAERDSTISYIGDIVDWTRRNAGKKFYPPHLVELLSYDGDEVYLFDTGRRSADGEWPVVCLNAGSSELEEEAPDFAAFLRRHLR